MPNRFDDFYKKNDSWLTYALNPLETLRLSYPDYFHTDEQARVNYQAIKQALLHPRDTTQQKKAREIFLNLFSMPHVTFRSYISTPALNQIETNFGAQITAHGVEESKGGMRTLLMIALTNKVQSPGQYFGALTLGAPDITALSHGPYYLIYSMPSAVKATHPDYPDFTEIAKVLVPFDENKVMLTDKLNEMHTLDLISTETRDEFIDKLMTYDDFLVLLEVLTPDTSKKRKNPDSKQASELANLSLFRGDERGAEEPEPESAPPCAIKM
jgi:hypothetical protein